MLSPYFETYMDLLYCANCRDVFLERLLFRHSPGFNGVIWLTGTSGREMWSTTFRLSWRLCELISSGEYGIAILFIMVIFVR